MTLYFDELGASQLIIDGNIDNIKHSGFFSLVNNDEIMTVDA